MGNMTAMASITGLRWLTAELFRRSSVTKIPFESRVDVLELSEEKIKNVRFFMRFI